MKMCLIINKLRCFFYNWKGIGKVIHCWSVPLIKICTKMYEFATSGIYRKNMCDHWVRQLHKMLFCYYTYTYTCHLQFNHDIDHNLLLMKRELLIWSSWWIVSLNKEYYIVLNFNLVLLSSWIVWNKEYYVEF